jgi:hypothetical protein
MVNGEKDGDSGSYALSTGCLMAFYGDSGLSKVNISLWGKITRRLIEK